MSYVCEKHNSVNHLSDHNPTQSIQNYRLGSETKWFSINKVEPCGLRKGPLCLTDSLERRGAKEWLASMNDAILNYPQV